MPSKKKVVKGEEERTPTLQGGLPLFTELPSNECSRKLGFRRCRFSETQEEQWLAQDPTPRVHSNLHTECTVYLSRKGGEAHAKDV